MWGSSGQFGGGGEGGAAAPTYSTYKALVNQSGTDAPVPVVLKNELGGAPVWAWTGAGNYSITLVGAFPANNTFVHISLGLTGVLKTVEWERANDDVINLYFYESDNSPVEYDGASPFSITIEVY